MIFPGMKRGFLTLISGSHKGQVRLSFAFTWRSWRMLYPFKRPRGRYSTSLSDGVTCMHTLLSCSKTKCPGRTRPLKAHLQRLAIVNGRLYICPYLLSFSADVPAKRALP